MIDLSNNNERTQDFKKCYEKGGQRRVYLKRMEGTGYVDPTFPTFKAKAEAASLKVGGYNFLHPLDATPAEITKIFLKDLGALRPGHELRPCLDVEYGSPSAAVGRWVGQVADAIASQTGHQPLIYGSGYFLQDCEFGKIPGPLWIAAFGRNDGRDYPVEMIPRPWHSYAAHQYTSVGTMPGINGRCDLSLVINGKDIEL